MSKVLITGANGQLGSELVDVFKSWDIVSTDQNNLDITKNDLTNKIVGSEKPDLIIHCAAWTDVEGCAENPEKARLINALGTKNVAEAAKAVGAKVVYISTNEVFDGKKSGPYLESDQTNPINSYAKSKLSGEKFIQEILGSSGVIVRTSWVYGPKGKNNFPLKILSAAQTNPELKVVTDEIAVPTYAPDLAKAIFDLVSKNPSGIYHLVNEGFCSRYDWAAKILEISGTNLNILTKIKLKDFKRLSQPPQKTVLDNFRAGNLGIKLPKWEEGLSKFFYQLEKKGS